MKKLIFFLLYFSEGAPIGFIWWALPAILTKQGFSITETATISSIATIPWTFKFILGPIIDLISLNFISLKRQLLFYQVLMGGSLFVLPSAILQSNGNLITILLLVHGVFAASQDICIDSLAIKSIPEDELGKTNGIMQAGMLVGRSFLGGAGVFIAFEFGISFLTYFLISSIWVSLIFLQRTKFNIVELPKIAFRDYLEDFLSLIKRPKFWVLVAITYFSGFSYNGLSTLGSAVLTKKEIDPSLIGITYSVFIPIAMTVGTLIAGKYCDQWSSKNILKISIVLCITSSLLVGLAMDFTRESYLLIPSYTLFYIFIGATTASLYSFLMGNTQKKLAALEFSIFMAVTNMADSSASYISGQLVNTYTYLQTGLIIGLLCFISYPLLIKTKD